MAKSGQARVLTPEQFQHVLAGIQQHRHAEKNTAIMQLSFKLGLRVQEIALLKIKEVARLSGVAGHKQFELLEILSLPAAYTKGANATRSASPSNPTYEPKSLRFKAGDFDNIVRQIIELTKHGIDVDPKEFYPAPVPRKGVARDLPMSDPALRHALELYLWVRLEKDPAIKKSDPLFLTQKGGPYSPNTLQDHMGMMLKHWAGIEKASSHSGRRTLLTDVIHGQGNSLKVAQKIAGHKSPATTVIYDEPTEAMIDSALQQAGQDLE